MNFSVFLEHWHWVTAACPPPPGLGSPGRGGLHWHKYQHSIKNSHLHYCSGKVLQLVNESEQEQRRRNAKIPARSTIRSVKVGAFLRVTTPSPGSWPQLSSPPAPPPRLHTRSHKLLVNVISGPDKALNRQTRQHKWKHKKMKIRNTSMILWWSYHILIFPILATYPWQILTIDRYWC